MATDSIYLGVMGLIQLKCICKNENMIFPRSC